MVFDFIEFDRIQKVYNIQTSYDDEANPTYHVTDKIWEYIRNKALPWITQDTEEDRLKRLGRIWSAKHGHKYKE